MNINLLQGDCRDVLKTLPDGSIDMIFTDPPYGHNNNNNGDLIQRCEAALGLGKPGNPRPIPNDSHEEANELFKVLLAESVRLLKPGKCICCCCGGGGGPQLQFAEWSTLISETPGLQFKQMVVWDKGPIGLGWHYRRSYEVILVAQRAGAKCAWYDTTHRIENIIRPGQYGIKKIIPRNDQHPTQKPVELAQHFIKLHTQPGDVVLDPFMGSGSTGCAAVMEGRSFIGIELSPEYIEMSKQRLIGVQKKIDECLIC